MRESEGREREKKADFNADHMTLDICLIIGGKKSCHYARAYSFYFYKIYPINKKYHI